MRFEIPDDREVTPAEYGVYCDIETLEPKYFDSDTEPLMKSIVSKSTRIFKDRTGCDGLYIDVRYRNGYYHMKAYRFVSGSYEEPHTFKICDFDIKKVLMYCCGEGSESLFEEAPFSIVIDITNSKGFPSSVRRVPNETSWTDVRQAIEKSRNEFVTKL